MVTHSQQAVMPQDPLPHPSSSPHHPVTPSRAGGAGSPLPFPSAAGSPPSNAPPGPGGQATPPKAGAQSAGKLRPAGTPKDTIPMAKTPRKQRSSRFHVTEKVELERLPGFMGELAPAPSFVVPTVPSLTARASSFTSHPFTFALYVHRGSCSRATRLVPPKATPMRGRVRLQRCLDRHWGQADQGGHPRRDARVDHHPTRRHHRERLPGSCSYGTLGVFRGERRGGKYDLLTPHSARLVTVRLEPLPLHPTSRQPYRRRLRSRRG